MAKTAKSAPSASAWEGIIANVQRRYDETSSEPVRAELEAFMVAGPCPACLGKRLKPTSLAVTVHGSNLGEVVQLSVLDAAHLSVLEQPQAFAAALYSLLSRLA